jgi:hypothetical protein
MEKNRVFKKEFSVRSKTFEETVTLDEVTGLSTVQIMEINTDAFRYCVTAHNVSADDLFMTIASLHDSAFEHGNKTMNDLIVDTLNDKGFTEMTEFAPQTDGLYVVGIDPIKSDD